MIFPYRTIISEDSDGDLILLRRPEIPVTIVGNSKFGTYIALVDTGSDSTILPKSVADYLGIPLHVEPGPPASVFGGHLVQLLIGDVILRLEADDNELVWQASVGFYDFKSGEEETVILGHAGFLDYFTATFDGKEGLLTLLPNDDLPSAS